jgi:hypothetical protein
MKFVRNLASRFKIQEDWLDYLMTLYRFHGLHSANAARVWVKTVVIYFQVFLRHLPGEILTDIRTVYIQTVISVTATAANSVPSYS